MNIKLLKSILQKSWSKETCYPPMQKDWTPENPALGQCAITALIVNDYFGGELLYCKHHYHYWNRLPDNSEVDFTRSQFPENIKICLDETRPREFNLENEYEKEAKTLERYAILKQRVENFLKQKRQTLKEQIKLLISKMLNKKGIIHMKNKINWLYLTSSNASEEYILDILEVLSVPSGFVQHFRYHMIWLDDALKKKLPKKGNKNSNLKNNKIVICYLYQIQNENKKEWIAIYPVRIGTLINAYKTGDRNEDVAHFYFKVDEYVSYNGKEDFTKLLKEIAGEKFGKNYAFLSQSFKNNYISNKKNSISAFHQICESLNIEHFKSDKGDKEYYPCFCFIDGLKNKKGEIVKFKYKEHSNKSFYEIKEGDYYSFNFNTYFPKSLKPLRGSIQLFCDNKIFSSPKKYELKISSRYDEESWIIASSLLERNIWTLISLKFDLKNEKDRKIPLNMCLNFPVEVKRKALFKWVEFVGVVFFGVVTATIVLSQIFNNIWPSWYILFIIFYAIWAISRFIVIMR